MAELSQHTANLLRELAVATHSKFWWSKAKCEESIHGLLEQLSETGEPAVLCYITTHLVAASEAVRKSARKTASILISQIPPYNLIHVNEVFSWCYGIQNSVSWDQVKPSAVAEIAGPPSDKEYINILGLLSFHSSGYVRHEAVRHLAEQFDGRELPYLLIRQNDWVKAIAKDAQSAVAQRITDQYAEPLARSLRLVLHLASFRRHDHQLIVNKILDLLLQSKHSDLLYGVIDQSGRDVVRQVVRYGLNKPGEHQRMLVAAGIRSDDVIVRLMCCRHLPSMLSGSELHDALDRLTTDKFMFVRREALRIKAERLPESAPDIWQHALVDPSRSVRDFARFSLSKLGVSQADIVRLCRDHVSQHPECLSCLEGLAETGDALDKELFRSLLHHPLPSRRVVAVKALNRISGEAATVELLPLMYDPSPKVIREVCKAISPFLHQVSDDQLLSVAINATEGFARSSAVRLISEFSKWRSVPLLLRVVAGADHDIRRFAEEKIAEWFLPPRCNRVYTRPTEQQRLDILSELQNCRGLISNETRHLIEEGISQSH